MVAQPAFPATYFVSQSGAGGKTGADVDNASAIATFNAGTAPYDDLDGDTVYFIGTITQSEIKIPDAGAAGNVITLRGDYVGNAGQLGNSENYVYLTMNSYVSVYNLTIYGAVRQSVHAYYYNNDSEFIAATNEIRDYDKTSDASWVDKHFMIRNAGDNNLSVFGVASVTDKGTYNEIIVKTEDAIWSVLDEARNDVDFYLIRDLTDIIVDGCTLYRGDGNVGAINIPQADNVTINNNIIDGQDTDMLGLGYYIDSHSIYKAPSNITITNNYMHSLGSGTDTDDNHLIYLQSVRGITISNNRLEDALCGIIVFPLATEAGKVTGMTITRNIIQGMDASRNTSGSWPGTGIYLTGADQCPLCEAPEISYNIIASPVNCPQSDATKCTGIGSKWSVQAKIYNNTLIGNDRNINVSTNGTSADLENNISISPQMYHIVVPSSSGTWAEDFDIYYPDGAYFYASGSARANLAAYKAAHPDVATQSATHLYTADPLLLSSTDFHLTSTSPAINAGVDVGLSQDYDGNGISGLPDIGAYEYQGRLMRGVILQGVTIQ